MALTAIGAVAAAKAEIVPMPLCSYKTIGNLKPDKGRSTLNFFLNNRPSPLAAYLDRISAQTVWYKTYHPPKSKFSRLVSIFQQPKIKSYDTFRNTSITITLFHKYQKAVIIVMRIFRWDLRLHFSWGFTLTLLGVYWLPLYGAGLAITVIQESLDIWSKGSWRWGDFWWGIVGSVTALLFLYTRGIGW